MKLRDALVLVTFVSASAFAACGGSAPPPAAPPPVASASAQPAADPHGFEADEFIVTTAPAPTEWTGAIEGRLAKMEKPAEKAGEGPTFFRIDNSREEKTAHFWKSKAAAKGDLKPGTLVAYLRTDGVKPTEAMPAPKDATMSRKGYWVVSHVTDVADLDKDVVKVGTQPVSVGAIRVLVTPEGT